MESSVLTRVVPWLARERSSSRTSTSPYDFASSDQRSAPRCWSDGRAGCTPKLRPSATKKSKISSRYRADRGVTVQMTPTGRSCLRPSRCRPWCAQTARPALRVVDLGRPVETGPDGDAVLAEQLAELIGQQPEVALDEEPDAVRAQAMTEPRQRHAEPRGARDEWLAAMERDLETVVRPAATQRALPGDNRIERLPGHGPAGRARPEAVGALGGTPQRGNQRDKSRHRRRSAPARSVAARARRRAVCDRHQAAQHQCEMTDIASITRSISSSVLNTPGLKRTAPHSIVPSRR